MKQIVTRLTCSKHPLSPSERIDSKMTTYCSLCETSDLTSLLNIENAADFVISKARDCAKTSSPQSLNKFMLQAVNYYKRPKISQLKDLNLLILETRDLINQVEFEVLRCVFCIKKVLFGKMTGIMNQCGHLICFTCCFNSDTGRCPIDDSKVLPVEYFNHDFIDFPECHSFHVFSDEKIFKLPCFHYSCRAHLAKGHCCVCGFEFCVLGIYKPVRVSMTASDVLDFIKVMCINHPDTEAEIFCMKLNHLCCSKCENYSKIFHYFQIPKSPKRKFNFFNNILQTLNSKASQVAFGVDLNIVKAYNYLKVLSMQKKFNYFKVLDVLINRALVISPKEMILFDVLPEAKHILDAAYYIDENTCLSFTLNAVKDMILSGFILNNKILTPTDLGSDFSLINSINFSAEDGRQDSRNIRSTKNINELQNNIELICSRHYFDRSIYLRANVLTQFDIRLSSGHYYLSKSFTKRRFKDLTLMKSEKAKSSVKKEDGFSYELDKGLRIIDGSLGCMLNGLIISPASDYLR